MSQDYIAKTRGFVTSHKLKEFKRCQICYKYRYIDEIPCPAEEDMDEKDAFVIGQAFDDLVTDGEESFNQAYTIVARRSKDTTEGPTQLTQGMGTMLRKMAEEYRAQSLFNPNPKKKTLELTLGGMPLRAELDDFDLEKAMIRDVKTCASVTDFNPDSYVWQMSFYQLLVEEIHGVKCEAMLMVVDKPTPAHPLSRSYPVIYTKATLEAERGAILEALDKLKEAEITGVFSEPHSLGMDAQMEMWRCPYYGYNGHGRMKQPFYF